MLPAELDVEVVEVVAFVVVVVEALDVVVEVVSDIYWFIDSFKIRIPGTYPSIVSSSRSDTRTSRE